ncbi:MAG TPA: hypothetical protein VK108_04190 [Pseudogracilibacillus sp.]|nr:hypothetical protein [Pseudogracilibacillus sp.]
MKREPTVKELAKRVEQQEETLVQLVKIIASTNHRVSEIQVAYEDQASKSL